ncbi:predicted protein [Postia placenta Mad-698-R]|nr:predicted protein [Postia placenta Mad-698-R]
MPEGMMTSCLRQHLDRETGSPSQGLTFAKWANFHGISAPVMSGTCPILEKETSAKYAQTANRLISSRAFRCPKDQLMSVLQAVLFLVQVLVMSAGVTTTAGIPLRSAREYTSVYQTMRLSLSEPVALVLRDAVQLGIAHVALLTHIRIVESGAECNLSSQ